MHRAGERDVVVRSGYRIADGLAWRHCFVMPMVMVVCHVTGAGALKLQIHAADRALSRRRLPNFRVHGAGVGLSSGDRAGLVRHEGPVRSARLGSTFQVRVTLHAVLLVVFLAGFNVFGADL